MAAKPRELRSDVVELNKRLLRMERTLARLKGEANSLSHCARDAQEVCSMLELKLLNFRLQAKQLLERDSAAEHPVLLS